MTIWEKVAINLEKASQKISATSALLADRIKTEITIVRLRLKRDELQSLVNEQYRIIGRSVVGLSKKEALPRSTEDLMADEEIVAAMAEIAARQRELEELSRDISREEDAFKTDQQNKEEKTL